MKYLSLVRSAFFYHLLMLVLLLVGCAEQRSDVADVEPETPTSNEIVTGGGSMPSRSISSIGYGAE
jgi:hypothetical protein